MALTSEQFDRAQPKFSHSQKGDEYMVQAEGLAPAAVPGQRIIGMIKDPDSPNRKVQVSVPHLPYERWIDAAGTVSSCPVKTNRVQKKGGKGSVDDGNYRSQMERQFLAAGWVRYDDGMGRNAKAIPEWTPEARDALIRELQAAHSAEAQANDKAWLDKKTKDADEIRKAMTDALSSFADGQKDRARRADKRAELDK